MPKIIIRTIIDASRKVVFELSRSIDFHKESTKHTQEEAISGRTSGLIKLGESVTWRAKHFGIWLILESKITVFNEPNYFTDEMVKGDFKSYKHEHIFKVEDGKTVMTDIFDYKSPFGLLGKLIDWLFLEKYMSKLLMKRNFLLKQQAESKLTGKEI